MAFSSSFSFVTLTSKEDEEVARALAHRIDVNDIFCWADPKVDQTRDGAKSDEDGTRSIFLTSRPHTHAAIARGVDEGRGRKGSVYIFSVPSLAKVGANCNWDSMMTSPFAIVVSSVTHAGFPAAGVPGSCISLTAPGSGDGVGLVTCDVGDTEHSLGKCNTNFGKDSAASSAAIASGVVSLMIQANPTLTWRDIRRILIETARPIGASGWRSNGARLQVHSYFGFGMIQAEHAVHRAIAESSLSIPAVPFRIQTGTPFRSNQSWLRYHSPQLSQIGCILTAKHRRPLTSAHPSKFRTQGQWSVLKSKSTLASLFPAPSPSPSSLPLDSLPCSANQEKNTDFSLSLFLSLLLSPVRGEEEGGRGRER